MITWVNEGIHARNKKLFLKHYLAKEKTLS